MDVSLKVLTKEDIPSLQELLQRCSDYLVFQAEEPVQEGAALALFNDMPEGVTEKDKVLFGILNERGQMVGVFDLIKGYINLRTLSLGLMLIEPPSRGRGIGARAYALVEEWALCQEFNKIRLGVLFGNEKGLRFWHRMGYQETGEIKDPFRPHLTRKITVLEKNIAK